MRLVVKDAFFIQAYNLLSQRLANVDPDYKDSACLHPDEAEMIGFIKAYVILEKESDPKFCTWLETKALPAIRKIGEARWPRSELTNLGLRIGSRDDLFESLTKDAETKK